jgi:hypothetical protein
MRYILAEGLANAFLEQVYGIRKLDEEKPQPEAPNAGSRLINNTVVKESNIITLNDAVIVYPNPANDLLNIEVVASDENTSIQLLDVTGKILISQSLQQSKTLNTANLNNGIYFIQLTQKDKIISVKKVVITH